jgi:hypothetical protein
MVKNWRAVGFFTEGHSNRQQPFKQEILYVLARVLRKELYE